MEVEELKYFVYASIISADNDEFTEDQKQEVIRRFGLEEDVFPIAIIEKLAIAEVEVYLYPFLSEWYVPETIGAKMYLWDGLGIGAFDERTTRELVVANN